MDCNKITFVNTHDLDQLLHTHYLISLHCPDTVLGTTEYKNKSIKGEQLLTWKGKAKLEVCIWDERSRQTMHFDTSSKLTKNWKGLRH